MKDNYDFSKGIRNPFAEGLKNGYTVTIHYDFTEDDKLEEEPGSDNKPDDDTKQHKA